MTTIPISIHNQLIPIDTLRQQGVRVSVVGDGFYDSWNPNFSGDILEKVQQFCEYTGKSSERALRESLGLITQGITPLDANGQQVWPVVGDEASFDFAEASCSAEVVARVPQNRQLMQQGKL